MTVATRQEGPVDDGEVVRWCRNVAANEAAELGWPELSDDAALLVSELTTNALLHGGGCTGLNVVAIEDGIRVEVSDANHVPPLLQRLSDSALTGRGMRLVIGLAARWGTEFLDDGKVVWAEITSAPRSMAEDLTADEVLAMWADDEWAADEVCYRVALGDVPTDLLLDAKSHVDNVVRELELASSGARSGISRAVSPELAGLLAAVNAFSHARVAIKHQALDAFDRGDERTVLELSLPASAAEAAVDYLAALDEIDSYCRAQRLLTLESPPQHRVFRRWYVEELVSQLRSLSAGYEPSPGQSFERRLLRELDRVAEAQRATEHAARLHSLAAALARASTPEAVANAVLNEGVAALGAAGGGLLLPTTEDRLWVPGAVGYDEDLIERLRSESRDAELPAALSLRTGDAVWIESRDDRDRRFPELVGLEAETIALCAVPMTIGDRTIGALRFSFAESRLFDEDERQFVLALAAQTAQALDRALLQQASLDVSRRLQRSLLPPRLPVLPGLDIAALYRPFGNGMDIGGDFYDAWEIDAGKWAIAIGDAAGTGPEAATMTALVRHTLRALTLGDAPPGRVMALLNRALLEGRPDLDTERFCTVLFGVVTINDRIEATMASGGHPDATIRRSDGTIEYVELRGSLLGLFPDAEVATATVALDAGDTLLLVTDGVLEARKDGHMFGTEGVERVLSSSAVRGGETNANALLRSLEDAVVAHTGTLIDDLAAVALHVRPS